MAQPQGLVLVSVDNVPGCPRGATLERLPPEATVVGDRALYEVLLAHGQQDVACFRFIARAGVTAFTHEYLRVLPFVFDAAARRRSIFSAAVAEARSSRRRYKGSHAVDSGGSPRGTSSGDPRAGFQKGSIHS